MDELEGGPSGDGSKSVTDCEGVAIGKEGRKET